MANLTTISRPSKGTSAQGADASRSSSGQMTNGERLARRDVKRQQIAFGMRNEIPRRNLPTVRPRISASKPKSGNSEKHTRKPRPMEHHSLFANWQHFATVVVLVMAVCGLCWIGVNATREINEPGRDDSDHRAHS